MLVLVQLINYFFSPPGAKSKLLCGATLVAPKFAITAAHCFFGGDSGSDGGYLQSHKKEEFFLVAKAYLGPRSKIVKRRIRSIWNPFEGDKWYPKKSPDLVVLKVKTPFPYKKGKIQPVCLPSRPVQVGARCHTSGWGRTCRYCPITKELNAIKVDILECPMEEQAIGIAIPHDMHIKDQYNLIFNQQKR